MKKLNYLAYSTMILLMAFAFSSCDKNNDKDEQKASVHLMLTDAPALYDQVLIDIQGVELHTENDGWITVPLLYPGIYNLLDFSNGADTLLGTVELNSGILSQVRFILGSNNSIVVDGVEHPLTVPSGSTSGLKFNVHQDIEAGYTYRFWLDFDAAHSVHQTGNGTYKLKPVIRMFTEASSGSIDGNVFPIEALPLVTVYNATDTLMAIPDSEGYFKIRGVNAGVYSVMFSTGDSTLIYTSLYVHDVPVVNGETTHLDSIILIP